jgi:hypothetical protein
MRRRKFWMIFGFVVVAAIPIVSDALYPHPYHAFLYEAMSQACRGDHFLTVRFLIGIGASPDGASDYDDGRPYNGFEFGSHVELTVSCHNLRILRYLISKGAKADTESLSTAINERQAEAVRTLLDAGANPYYTRNWTAADQATALGYPEIAKIVKSYLKH